MGNWHSAIDWFSGNGAYHSLQHCMANDWPWIWTTVLLDVAVAGGYAIIAYHWWVNERNLPARAPARVALSRIRNIFIFCAICGYVFIPIKMVWPAWRLYDIFLAVLVWFTWRYALGTKGLKVVYNELGRTRQLQEELEASREESRRKSFFLNALSHDLRTPLNGLTLQATLAEMDLQSNNAKGAFAAIEEIKSCAHATAELLDSLLEYAKVDWSDDGNTLSTFDLGTALQELAARLRGSADEKKITLHVGAIRGTAVQTDRIKLERIIVNLLSNAIKFTDQGGVRVEVQRNGRDIEIHVIDSGPGIEPSARERLFEEFFQAHNHERDRRKGFGLGLAIARRLVRQLGGDIVVDSALGSGSRFTVVLPGVVVVDVDGAERLPEPDPGESAAIDSLVVTSE